MNNAPGSFKPPVISFAKWQTTTYPVIFFLILLSDDCVIPR